MYAQDAPSWKTKAKIESSKAEVERTLRRLGATGYGNYTEREEGKLAFVVVFEIDGHRHRMRFQPLEIDRRRTRIPIPQSTLDHAEAQMYRNAIVCLKAMITFREANIADVLMVFRELPGGGPTMQDLGHEGFMQMITDANNGMLALPTPGGE